MSYEKISLLELHAKEYEQGLWTACMEVLARDLRPGICGKRVKQSEIQETLLKFVAKRFKKKVAPENLIFYRINLDANFLNSLKTYIHFSEGAIQVLTLTKCQVYLNQKELEDFICPLKLNGLCINSNRFHENIEINDKMLLSVTNKFKILDSEVWRCVQVQITDKLIEYWKANSPRISSSEIYKRHLP